MTEDRIWTTGFAPCDALFRQGGAARAATAPGRHMVLYAPTYHAQFTSAAMLGEKAAALIAGGREDLSIVIKPHPLFAEYRPRWMAAWGQIAASEEHVHLIRDPAADITPYLLAADVLVSDASGVAFQYLALDRPMVLITNPEHTRDAESYNPEAIEWRWRDVGQEVTDVSTLARAVGRALDDPGLGAGARARYRGLLFGDLTDGRATERIVDRVGRL